MIVLIDYLVKLIVTVRLNIHMMNYEILLILHIQVIEIYLETMMYLIDLQQ